MTELNGVKKRAQKVVTVFEKFFLLLRIALRLTAKTHGCCLVPDKGLFDHDHQ